MAWKPGKDVSPDQSGEGDWLNWLDGETKGLIVLTDQPVRHTIHWVQGKGQPCEGRGCSACSIGMSASQRFTVMADAGAGEVRWEMAALTWRDLASIAEMQGTLRGLRLRVRRSGSGKAQRFMLIADGIVPESELPPEPAQGPAHFEPEPGAGAGLVSGDYTNGYAVAADPAGASAYAKELASSLDTTAKAVLWELADAGQATWAALSSEQQLHRLIVELERRLQALGEAAKEAEVWSVDDLLS